MSEPPEHDRPEDGSGEDELSLSEPPVKPTDTQPLKPLGGRTPPEVEVPLPDPEPPPATVLKEAGVSEFGEDALSISGETERIRLVPLAPDPMPWRVIFQTVQPSPTRIGLNVWQSLVIGRTRSAPGEGPDLDLSPYNAAGLGVSRRHAVLVPGPDALFVQDLESTNGTWVNNRFLEPGARHPLAAGDRIEFGLLELVVKTVIPIVRSSDG